MGPVASFKTKTLLKTFSWKFLDARQSQKRYAKNKSSKPCAVAKMYSKLVILGMIVARFNCTGCIFVLELGPRAAM